VEVIPMASEHEGPDVVAPPPLLYSVPLVGGFLLDRVLPLPFLPRRLTRTLGLAALAGGVALAGWFASTMTRAETPIDLSHAPTRLVVSGPFQYSRNPGYLGLAAIYAGLALLARARWSLLLLPAVLATIDRGVIEREERYLRGRFGDEYVRYLNRVRRWI
jgi:protein-S-isoprenylcysteine O-methyltransferase Ste14